MQEPTQQPQETQKSTSFGSVIRDALTPSDEKRSFPWYQTGILLVGFTLGALVTTGVDIASRLQVANDTETNVVSAADRCKEEGGRYDRESDSCIYVTEDRGEGCSKNSDCDGWCLAPEDADIGTEMQGECSEGFTPQGCFKFIDNGMVNSICMP